MRATANAQVEREVEVATPAENAGGAALTPMMRQYLEVKAQHPETILFFRLGDFYEMFFDDAVRAAEILQITLTSRAKGDGRIPMCGVPYHSARRYVARLIDAGLSVAICEQVEDAKNKGPTIVRREVVRVITPGMVLDEEVLEPRENNFLACLAEHAERQQKRYALALLDASTGEFTVQSAPSLDALADELSRSGARELLVSEPMRASAELERLLERLPRRPALSVTDEGAFEPKRAEAYLKGHFRVAALDGFGIDGEPATLGAAGAALRYVKTAQKTEAAHIDRIRVSPRGQYLIIDEASRTNLELIRSLRDGARHGSLLGVIDKTATSMGARKLAAWITAPLRSVQAIEARLDAVEALVQRAAAREELAGELREVADIERLCGRLSLGAGNARDMKALGRSLLALERVAQRAQGFAPALLQSLAPPLLALPELGKTLDQAILDEPKAVLTEGGLFKPGYSAELDELVELSTSGKDYLLKLEARERERTGVHSLKVRYNKVFGYYIEVTRANLGAVPPEYVRKQTTVGAERFVTPELKEYEEKVLTAEERRCALEQSLFEALRAKVVAQAGRIRAAAEATATLDALVSFARVAADYGYVRPKIEASGRLELEGGRHPVVERLLMGEPFVPNDVRLDCDESQLIVITGPNMAGKSTVMRQVALSVILAQAGAFVPARRATIGLCDRVFTRVGASDNLSKGQSTFMVEMSETASILHHATRRSLVVLDEIGRGTSTFDGLSIAWAVAEHLHDQIGARTLFATHYHELTELAADRRRVKNCSVAVKEQGGKVLFLRKLVEGGASRSYGIEVARLAGLPPEVLQRARHVLASLERGEFTLGHLRQHNPQLGLFAMEPITAVEPSLSPQAFKVLEELRTLPVDQTTPLEALNLLARWRGWLG